MTEHRILVTGGSGFIGTNLIDFYKKDNKVLNLDISEPRNKEHTRYWDKVNINDYHELERAIIDFSPDIVIHMAARTDLDGKSLDDYASNIRGVKNILEITNKIDSISKVIFASSRLVCEIGYTPKDEFDYRATTIYGESKVIGEKLVRDFSGYTKEWIIVRPTSIWGPWFDVPYKTFFTAIKNKRYVHPKNINIYKHFGYVKNSVYIIDKLIDNDKLNGKAIYLSDFTALEVHDWANMISNQFHRKDVREVPLAVLNIGAYAGDCLKYLGYTNPPLTSFRLDNLLTEMLYDIKDVENEIGNLPFSLESGVVETVNWMAKYD